MIKANKSIIPKRRTSLEIANSLKEILPNKLVTKLSRVNTLSSKDLVKIENLKSPSIKKSNKDLPFYKSEKLRKSKLLNFDISKFKYLKHVPIQSKNFNGSITERKEINILNPVYLKKQSNRYNPKDIYI